MDSGDQTRLAPYYPQSAFWKPQQASTELAEAVETFTEKVKLVYIRKDFSQIPCFLLQSLQQRTEEKLLKEELDSLFKELNQTLQILKLREEENREKINDIAKLNSYQFLNDKVAQVEPEELILVNVWNNLDGKLSLTEKKPLSRTEFEEMDKRKDFSGLFSTKESHYLDNPPIFQV